MRPLTDDEMKTFFLKLQQYIGNNLTKLIDRKDEPSHLQICERSRLLSK